MYYPLAMVSPLKYVVALISLAAAHLQLHPERALDARLNVLMIAVDDLRPEIGIHGYPHVQTPRLDGLALSGIRFAQAYAQWPVCAPSRASFFTGRMPVSVSGAL